MRACLVAAALLVAVMAVPAAMAGERDRLTAHNKSAMELTVYRTLGVADGGWAPNFETAKWRFVSDFYRPWRKDSLSIAYATVTWKTMDLSRGGSALFGFDLWGGGRWKKLGFSHIARPVFRCDTSVLLNPNGWIDQQIRMVKKVATCQ